MAIKLSYSCRCCDYKTAILDAAQEHVDSTYDHIVDISGEMTARPRKLENSNAPRTATKLPLADVSGSPQQRKLARAQAAAKRAAEYAAQLAAELGVK